MQHANARLTPNGRLQMVRLVEEQGLTFEAAAAASNVSKSTVWEWVRRWRQAAASERRLLSCLADRSSRPGRSPRMLCEADQRRICAVRQRTGWGPRLIASETGHPHATVHRTLARHRLSRRPSPLREAVVRYEWPCPGNLLHMDVKRFAGFREPGHAVTGDRTRRSPRAGWVYAHSVIDDCSRLAYTELHPNERAETVTAFTRRALDFFLERGIVAERLMSDNAFAYVKNRGLRALLRRRAIRHLRTRPYTPKTNGKVERYQQTLAREWGYGLTYNSSSDRDAALPHWLDYYNERRRHSAIGDCPPMARVRNVLGQDS